MQAQLNDPLAAGLDLLDIGVAVFDADRRLMHANAAFRSLRRYPDALCRTGVTLDDLLRHSATRGDFGPGEVEDQVSTRIAQIEAAAERRVERRMDDGLVLSILYRRAPSGCLTISIKDRTEEARAQTALAASEERHAMVAEMTSDGIYDWNVTEDRLFVSDRMTRMLDLDVSADEGFDPGAQGSGRWGERVHPDDLARYSGALRDHFRGRTEALDCTYRLRDVGGRHIWVHDRGGAIRGPDGRVTRLVGAVQDVTEMREAKAAVERIETRLMTALSSISDGILLVDAEDRVLMWNDRYREIFSQAAGGVDISDVIRIGRPFFEMLRDGYAMGMFHPHPDGIEVWLAARRDAWAKPETRREIELRNGDWILFNERRLPDGGHVSVFTNITAMKRREAEAEAARRRFEEALAAIASGFALWDADDRLVVCNARYRAYFPGIDDLVAPGARFADLILAAIRRGLFPGAESDPEAALSATMARRAIASGAPREQHMVSGLWLQITDHRTAEGGIVSIYTDVSELKAKQFEIEAQSRELTAALQEFHAVLDTIDYGIAFTGPDLRTRMGNRAFREMWNISEAFIAGRPHMRDLIGFNRNTGLYTVAPADFDAWAEDRVTQIAAGPIARRDFARGDGRVLSYECVALPDGGRMLTYFDITAIRAHEAAILRAKEAAEAALADLRVAQRQLVHAEKMASLGQLTAGIAHEIKNPLNFVNNFARLSAEMMEELAELLAAPTAALEEEDRNDAEDLIETVRGNLVKIDQHGRRADSIVRNMLLHSRTGPSEMQAIDINALALEAMNLAYHGARAADPTFNVDIASDLPDDVRAVSGHPQDLQRVFLNLCSNGMYAAAKRAAGGGDPARLAIATRMEGDDVVIEIRDNGAGVPDAIRDSIFQPFFTTKPTGEGTGLGLSMSYDIVRDHGGRLSLMSDPGGGAVFRVSLPAQDEGAR